MICLNKEEIEILGFIANQYWQHSERCDNITNRSIAEKQRALDLEKVAVIEKVLSQTCKHCEELMEVNRALISVIRRVVEIEDSHGMGVMGWPEVMDNARKLLIRWGKHE